MKQIDPETLKIPAFRRKRSIQGRARNKILFTALDRKEAGVPVVKPVQKVSTIRRRPVKRLQPSYPVINLESSCEPSCESLPNLREMQLCGICEGYLEKINVALVELSSSLKVGDRLLFETDSGLFEQVVESMQINRKDVQIARSGSGVGMKVLASPLKGGKVYKVI